MEISSPQIEVSRAYIDTMPPEILVQFFARCIGPRFDVYGIQGETRPWDLSHVCRDWRDIIFNTQHLWCSFEIYLDFEPDSKAVREKDTLYPVEPLQEVLRLSGAQMLDIEYIADAAQEGGPAERTQRRLVGKRLLQELIIRANRWSVVHLRIPLFLFRYLDQIDSLPSLQHLQLEPTSDEPDVLNLAAFETAPLLTSINLHMYDVAREAKFPWDQLQSMKLTDVHREHVPELLLWCPNLRNLELDTALDDDMVSNGEAVRASLPFTHDALRTLRITGPDYLRAFDQVILPALASLEVGTLNYALSNFRNLISNTSSLGSLDLDFETLTIEIRDGLAAVLGSLGQLKSLKVCIGSYSRPFLDEDLQYLIHLLSITETRMLLPRLCLLKLVASAGGESREITSLDSGFVDMLRSRWWAAEPELKFVLLSFQPTRISRTYPNWTIEDIMQVGTLIAQKRCVCVLDIFHIPTYTDETSFLYSLITS